MKEFSDVNSREELALALRVPLSKLTYILYVATVDSCYRTFEIPKKNGGTRVINAPQRDLMDIQKNLAKLLYEHRSNIKNFNNVKCNIAHAFEKEKGIITNGSVHRNKRIVLNYDLENFFDSFHFGRVRGYFWKNRYFRMNLDVATIIAQLTCYQGKLPQGAPTSPIITNMICEIFDFKLLRLAKKYKLDYTRYADDLTFSTNNAEFENRIDEFTEELSKEIDNAGFKINRDKTRLQLRKSRQTVTGLVVNEKVSVDHRYYKATRAMAHNLYREGGFDICGEEGSLEQLEGRFSFVNQIDKYNNKLEMSGRIGRSGRASGRAGAGAGGNEKKKHDFRHLNGREREDRKFLFYKDFVAGERPMIVTEGKTDILYIKAALKSFYKEYPELIEKRKDGTFDFKIDFLRRSEKLKYFFGLTADGADSMKNLYNYFSDMNNNSFPNYAEYFGEKMKCAPLHPTILIFDNELEGKDKPLKKFTDHIKMQDRKESLKRDLAMHISGSLFIATLKLPEGKKEAEAEDMFAPSVLEHEIRGKRFSRSDEYDKSKFYGKNDFAQYVFFNYKEIDFSGFRPMLDSILMIKRKYRYM